MKRIEAAMHFGIARRDPPTAMELRDLIFASAIADTPRATLVTSLVRAWIAADRDEHAEDDEDYDGPEVATWHRAEEVYIEAYKSTGNNAEDATYFDELASQINGRFPVEIARDLGHLIGYHDAAQSRAIAEYFATHKGE